MHATGPPAQDDAASASEPSADRLAREPAGLLSNGARIGHFEILREIGRGGMGVVYRAFDLRLRRKVALKVLPEGKLEDSAARTRFLNEARSASGINHPNIVTIYEVDSDQGHDFIAMELVEGRPLNRLIADGPLEIDAVLRWAIQIASALERAHRSGVVHRDLKPHNVIVTREGEAKVLDFGLAKSLGPILETVEGDLPTEELQPPALTARGMVVGTPHYMSPEQAEGLPLDRRSDVFSLGTVLFEMLTGRLPFSGRSVTQLLVSVARDAPPPLRELRPEIPRELERIVLKCLAKRPGERYQDASDLLEDLRAEARRADSESYASDLTLRPARLRRTIALLAVAGGCSVLALAAWTLWTHRSSAGGLLPQGHPRQITAAASWEAEVAISPDGELLAYASNQSGNADIWLVDVRGGNPIQLTRHPASDRAPAWFPDGSALAFHSDREGDAIWKIPRLGGAASMLVADALDPAISPDGNRIAFAKKSAGGDHRIGVARLGDPASEEILTDARGGLWGHRNPAWSPDGALLAYADFSDLWIVPSAGGAARQLTADHAGDREPAWSANGRFVYFSSFREETLALWRISRNGGSPERLTLGAGPERRPSVSRDGSRLAYTTFVTDYDIVLIDLSDGERVRLPGDWIDWGVTFAPDLSAVAFVSHREAWKDLWLQPLERLAPSAPARRLTSDELDASNPEFSPGGRFVAYSRRSGGHRNVWVVPTSGGVPWALTEGPGVRIHPSWSQDRSRIAYVEDQPGGSELWLAPVREGRPNGTPQRLVAAPHSLMWPRWSANDRFIAYLGADGTDWEVWITPIEGDPVPRQITRGAEAENVRWDQLSGQLMVSGRWGEGELSLRRVDPATGAVTPLEVAVNFGPAAQYGQFDLSSDGRVLGLTREEVRGDLWILEADEGVY